MLNKSVKSFYYILLIYNKLKRSLVSIIIMRIITVLAFMNANYRF